MSEEFKNEFDENKETETDNVNTQEETETVFEDNASKPEETTNESAVTQEPGNAANTGKSGLCKSIPAA